MVDKLTAMPTTYSLPIVRPAPGVKTKPIRTQARSATILPSFVGLKFQVHNGKDYTDVFITEDMVGHKLGEFSTYVVYMVSTRGHPLRPFVLVYRRVRSLTGY